ncbi:MAG: SGNH/GDSL hydrolase family protein [Myxococcales bacterium]|nr:SGNH/GDSL hydrolase family protein [Myxococcales bacterium]
MTRAPGAFVAFLSAVACACASNAPASSRPPAPHTSATDWAGSREPGAPGGRVAASAPGGGRAPFPGEASTGSPRAASTANAALLDGLAPDGGSPDSAAPGAAHAAAGHVVAGAWVLHVGDSFVDAFFAQNLAPRFADAGARQVALSKTSTSTISWAYDEDLDTWLARRPALVLVTVGANEVDIPSPRYHAGAIRRIAAKIGAVAPCVWITPPLWKPDRAGWLQVIHDECAPCLFFDSDAVLEGGGLARSERRGDGIHPNPRGGARWASAFWGWLEEHRDEAKGGWALAPFDRRGP